MRRTAAAIALAAALGGCGSGSGGPTTRSHFVGHHFVGHHMTKPIPAQIDRRPQGFFSSDLVRPLTDAWRAADRRRFTEVDAGAFAPDRSVGVLAIFRHQFVRVRQHVDLVKVIGSGPLRITGGPRGEGAATPAQRRGSLRFVGAAGVRGELHLRDDTVTLRPAR